MNNTLRMKGRIRIDPMASKIWGTIEDDTEKVDMRNWLSLCYSTPNELIVTGSGERGLEEAKSIFYNDTISFCLVFGVQNKGYVSEKFVVEPVRVVFLWVPENTDPLKRAQAVYDVDEVVSFLKFQDFCLLGASRKKEIKKGSITQQVSEIRGSSRLGKYFFDENVYRLRKKSFDKRKEAEAKNSSSDEEKIERMKMKSSHVLRELLSTERHYVKSLNCLMDMYVQPIKTHGHQKEYTFVHSMVNTILSVNSQFYEALLKVYEIDGKDSEDDKKFQEVLSKLGPDFFNERRISMIVDGCLDHFKTFKFYIPYVSQYSKMENSISNLLSKNVRLSTFFNVANEELRKAGERNTDYDSFLIMPIQRIPRYQLLIRELLKFTIPSSSTSQELYEKVERTLEFIKNLASKVNESKENIIKVQKTIHASRRFDKPELMGQKLLKYRIVEIINETAEKSTTSQPQKQSQQHKDSTTEGEIYVFEKTILITEFLQQKTSGASDGGGKKRRTTLFGGFGGGSSLSSSSNMSSMSSMPTTLSSKFDQTQRQHQPIKLFCEIDLKNPMIRCYRKYGGSTGGGGELLELEDDVQKVYLRFVGGGDQSIQYCDEIVALIQSNISKFHGFHRAFRSLYATRVLFKSWLFYCDEQDEEYHEKKNMKKKYFVLVCGDLKMKLFDKEGRKDREMIESYSLIGGNYGIRKGGGGLDFCFFITVPEYERDIDSYLYFGGKRIKMKRKRRTKRKKKKKDKIKDDEDDEDERKTVYFKAESKELMDTWLGVLDMLDLKDDKEPQKEEEDEGEEEEEEVPVEVPEEVEEPETQIDAEAEEEEDLDTLELILRSKDQEIKKLKEQLGQSESEKKELLEIMEKREEEYLVEKSKLLERIEELESLN